MRRRIANKINLQKITGFAIAVNAVQIVCALAILLYAIFNQNFTIPESAEIALVAFAAALVIWGAVVDIRDAIVTRKVEDQRRMLEEAYRQLEDLNRTLRAQRHDFKNHLQVVYSLTEMAAYDDVQEYVQRIYEDVQSVGSHIRTSVPAVNALISAKAADCAERGITFHSDIQSQWDQVQIPGWEMCRILGNLVDNAMDAVLERKDREPWVRVYIGEDIRCWKLEVSNNGPEIPASRRRDIFQPGFTTKSAGHGNGLSIVSELLEKYNGEMHLSSDAEVTRFSCTFPRCAPKP